MFSCFVHFKLPWKHFVLQDFEMVRIFDSMVYEDETQDDLTMGITASGALDPSQTRQALYLSCTYVSDKACMTLIHMFVDDSKNIIVEGVS